MFGPVSPKRIRCQAKYSYSNRPRHGSSSGGGSSGSSGTGSSINNAGRSAAFHHTLKRRESGGESSSSNSSGSGNAAAATDRQQQQQQRQHPLHGEGGGSDGHNDDGCDGEVSEWARTFNSHLSTVDTSTLTEGDAVKWILVGKGVSSGGCADGINSDGAGSGDAGGGSDVCGGAPHSHDLAVRNKLPSLAHSYDEYLKAAGIEAGDESAGELAGTMQRMPIGSVLEVIVGS